MKNKMLLTLALGLAGVTSLTAATVDVYLTGSTAFRANVYTACTKLYSSAPTIYFGDSAHGGDGNGNAKTASWCMTGTPITAMTNISAGNTLVIHGLFTGSVQGVQTVEQHVQLTFAAPVGTVGVGAGFVATSYVNKTPTIGFSDASASSMPYTVSGNYAQEDVCAIPFIAVRSKDFGVGNNGLLTNIVNLTSEQLFHGIPNGYLPLSAWTYKSAHTNINVYLAQRTLDSGTRRVETACAGYQYGDTVGVYIYDVTNNNFYLPTSAAIVTAAGGGNAGVIGGAGLSGANTNWGTGYVGGGQIAAALNANTFQSGSNNTQIAIMSMGDAQSVGAANWATAISFNGLWPTTAGANIRTNTLTSTGFTGAATNDYTPVTSGYYPLWGKEILVHVVDPTLTLGNDQDITKTQLGTQVKPGSFLGVFNAQTIISTNLNGIPLVGSIENEIELSKTNLATAIRLNEMKSNRSDVGGEISPF